jgi:exonuclease SbcC
MIEELTLRGFKSYKVMQTIRFTRGVNKISGRNASGKTTILEAVLFGLFGDVPGVDKRDLLPVTGGELYVRITFRTPKRVKITIDREATLAKNGAFKTTRLEMDVEGDRATISRERDLHDRLRELLGISSGTFFNVVYARQKEFVDILKPDKERMNAILGLTTPSEVREELREVRRLLEQRGGIADKGALEERAKNAEQTLKEGGAQLESETKRRDTLSRELEEKCHEFQASKVQLDSADELSSEFRKMDRLRNEVEVTRRQFESRGEELQSLLSDLGEEPERRREELTIRKERAEASEERLRRLVDEDLSGRKTSLRTAVEMLSHQLSDHGELKQSGVAICPKCGQKIDFQLLEKEIAEWISQLDEKRRKLMSLDAEIKDIQGQTKIAREKSNQARDELNGFLAMLSRVEEVKRVVKQLEERARSQNEGLESKGARLMNDIGRSLGLQPSSLEDAGKRLEERLKTLGKVTADLQAEVKSRSDRLGDLERILRELENRLKGIEAVLKESREKLERIAEYGAKIRALDGISNRYNDYERDLRENTLRLLEYQTFEYFKRLTDQQLYSNCHIDRERYTLEVHPKGSPRPLPAWRVGGGHESLFALAERLALLRVRNFPHLLILDEPTDAVDSENVPHLLEYIARSSREIGQVLLVTHHGQGEEEGVNLLRVRKVNGESRVSQEDGEG